MHWFGQPLPPPDHRLIPLPRPNHHHTAQTAAVAPKKQQPGNKKPAAVSAAGGGGGATRPAVKARGLRGLCIGASQSPTVGHARKKRGDGEEEEEKDDDEEEEEEEKEAASTRSHRGKADALPDVRRDVDVSWRILSVLGVPFPHLDVCAGESI